MKSGVSRALAKDRVIRGRSVRALCSIAALRRVSVSAILCKSEVGGRVSHARRLRLCRRVPTMYQTCRQLFAIGEPLSKFGTLSWQVRQLLKSVGRVVPTKVRMRGQNLELRKAGSQGEVSVRLARGGKGQRQKQERKCSLNR